MDLIISIVIVAVVVFLTWLLTKQSKELAVLRSNEEQRVIKDKAKQVNDVASQGIVDVNEKQREIDRNLESLKSLQVNEVLISQRHDENVKDIEKVDSWEDVDEIVKRR
jgi:Co/Zn/Cd efflux system component